MPDYAILIFKMFANSILLFFFERLSSKSVPVYERPAFDMKRMKTVIDC